MTDILTAKRLVWLEQSEQGREWSHHVGSLHHFKDLTFIWKELGKWKEDSLAHGSKDHSSCWVANGSWEDRARQEG